MPAQLSDYPPKLSEPSYRPAKPFPWRLRETSIVYFETEQYLEAVGFLNAVLNSGSSVSTLEHPLPALAPFPQQLALAASLTVHPRFTTRAQSTEDTRASNEALRLLKNVNSIVGPVNADFASAFVFQSINVSRRGTRRRNTDMDGESDEEGGEKLVKSKLANEWSVWEQGEDFWHVVGWAFNCSVKYKKRWSRWKLWLELILDIMEADWMERGRQYDEKRDKVGAEALDILSQSVIAQYLSSAEGRTGRRRILRAILADATTKSTNEFREVFKSETAERKKKEPEKLQRPRKLNIDEGDFGDYGIDEEDDIDISDANAEDTSQAKRGGAAEDPSSDVSEVTSEDDDRDIETPLEADEGWAEAMGGMESISLRQRILCLLVRVSIFLPKHFTHIEDLFDIYTEFMRPLPIQTFGLFVSTLQLEQTTLQALLVNLLLPLLGLSRPGCNMFLLTQKDVERRFLALAANANSTADNAKVSLVLESLLTSMFQHEAIQVTESFTNALEVGIKARKSKAIGDARKKGRGKVGDEEAARKMLQFSAERLMALSEVMGTAAGVTPKPRSRTFEHMSSDLSSLTEMDSTDEDDIE